MLQLKIKKNTILYTAIKLSANRRGDTVRIDPSSISAGKFISNSENHGSGESSTFDKYTAFLRPDLEDRIGKDLFVEYCETGRIIPIGEIVEVHACYCDVKWYGGIKGEKDFAGIDKYLLALSKDEKFYKPVISAIEKYAAIQAKECADRRAERRMTSAGYF